MSPILRDPVRNSLTVLVAVRYIVQLLKMLNFNVLGHGWTIRPTLRRVAIRGVSNKKGYTGQFR